VTGAGLAARSERMRGGEEERERFPRPDPGGQARVMNRQALHGHVEGAVEDTGGHLEVIEHFHQAKVDVRQLSPELAENRSQWAVDPRPREGDRQPPRPALRRQLHVLDQRIGLGQHALPAPDERLACCGRSQPGTRAHEKLDTQSPLKSADLPAQGG
jgi:hypothetical protein